MKLLVILLAAMPFLAFGDESYFFTIGEEPTGQRIEDESLHLVFPIKRLDPPAASSIIGFHQGLGPGRKYKIQVNLKSSPVKGWMPMLNLGGDIILYGISVSRHDNKRFASTFSLEGDDPEKIRQWCKHLGSVLKLSEENIEINLEPSAIAPETKPDGQK